MNSFKRHLDAGIASFILNSINANATAKINSIDAHCANDGGWRTFTNTQLTAIVGNLCNTFDFQGFLCVHYTHTHKSQNSNLQLPKCGPSNCVSFSLVFRVDMTIDQFYRPSSYLQIPFKCILDARALETQIEQSRNKHREWDWNRIHTGIIISPKNKRLCNASSASNIK